MGYQYDELILLRLILVLKEDFPHYSVRDILNAQEWIPVKRCWYYLEKFCGRDWYNYGVCLDLGWLQLENIPQEVYKAMELI
jgi:hypothetical protein